MTGITSVFAGIVRVPLFDNAFVSGLGQGFGPSCYGPVYRRSGQTQGLSPQLMFNEILMPMAGGLSDYSLGVQNQPGFQTGGVATYADGVIKYVGTSHPGLGAEVASFFSTRYTPRPNISIVGHNYWSVLTDFLIQTNKGYMSDCASCTYKGQKAFGALYGTGFPNAVSVSVVLNNAFVNPPVPYINDPGPGLWGNLPLWPNVGTDNGSTHSLNRMTPGAQGNLSFNMFMDNCILVSPSFTFSTQPAKVAWLSSLFPGNSIVQELHFDNPVLENLWTNAGVAHVPFITIFPYGFIATIFANGTAGNPQSGTGPTKQIFETVVFNSDCTQYYLLQFVPMDAISTAQISGIGNNWTTVIDEQGIVWMQSQAAGASQHVSSSFSPQGTFIPVIQAPPLNPFVLPCYNTCSPVPIIENEG